MELSNTPFPLLTFRQLLSVQVLSDELGLGELQEETQYQQTVSNALTKVLDGMLIDSREKLNSTAKQQLRQLFSRVERVDDDSH